MTSRSRREGCHFFRSKFNGLSNCHVRGSIKAEHRGGLKDSLGYSKMGPKSAFDNKSTRILIILPLAIFVIVLIASVSKYNMLLDNLLQQDNRIFNLK